MKKKWIIFNILPSGFGGCCGSGRSVFQKGERGSGAPGEVLQAYMDKILEKDYQACTACWMKRAEISGP